MNRFITIVAFLASLMPVIAFADTPYTDFIMAAPHATVPPGSGDLMPIIQNGVTKSISPSALGGSGFAGIAPTTMGDLSVWNNTGGTSLKGTNGLFNANPYGVAVGYNGTYVPEGSIKIASRNIYSGSQLAPSAMFGRLDYKPEGGMSSNPNGMYGILWYNSTGTFTGQGAGGRFNAYTVAQLSATVANQGSGYADGDVVTIVGGTCNTLMNTPPFFTLSVSNGVVTGATFGEGTGACSPYPANPVSVTGGSGTGLTLNLSNAPVNVDQLIGTIVRPRHQAVGTVNYAISAYADGCWNSGGGVLTTCVNLWMDAPHGENPVNTIGIWVNGPMPQGVISAIGNTDINFVNYGTGLTTTNSEFVAGIGQPCRASTHGGPSSFVTSYGDNCYLWVNSQTGGQTVISNGQLAVAAFSAPANAVNYLGVSAGPTGSPPFIGVSGPDTDISLRINVKGNGQVVVGNATPGSFGVEYPSSAASNPATFVANRYVKITTDNGATAGFIPMMTTPW